ncbi:MAG: chemotaxis protein CheW [Cyanobacteriota bacterium ELA615]|jgi:chemotaxis-related protein WspB
MLFLLFQIEENRYALETTNVVEVIPMVVLKKVYNAPSYMAGFFNYRGLIVPVVDFSSLVKEESKHIYLTTRIIILKYYNQDNMIRYLGLIAEKVTETINKPISELIEPDINYTKSTYISKIMINQNEIIQCIEIEDILKDSEPFNLLLEGAS